MSKDPEEAQLAAEVATEHAEKAAEIAADAERELAEATKSKASARLCPHDNAEMVRHDDSNPFKAGAWHCNTCGCCWRGKTLRDGHPQCAGAAAA